MSKVNISDYKDLYLKTAKEYADSLSKSCIELAKDMSNKDAINNLHISSHSLRSQSQVMGYNNMSNIAGAIEKIASAVLEGRNKINNDLINVLKEAVEALSLCLSQIEKGNKENDLEPIIKKLEMLKQVQYDTVTV